MELTLLLHPICKHEKDMKRIKRKKGYGPVGLNQTALKKSNTLPAPITFKLIDNYTVIQQTSVIFIP
jgi:hypothetical protein